MEHIILQESLISSSNNLNDAFSSELVLNASQHETISQLLLNGADINYQSSHGWCLLFELVILGLDKEIAHLASFGIDLQIRDDKGRSALFWAIHKEQTLVVERLIELGCKADEEVYSSLSALEYAEYKNNEEILDILNRLG